MILVAWKLECHPNQADSNSTQWQKLKRVDFPGIAFLSIAILSALLVFDMGGQKVPWTSPVVLGLASTSMASATVFALVESNYAREPIFPLRLLKHVGVVLPYLLLMLANASQTAVNSNTACCISTLLTGGSVAHALRPALFRNHQERLHGCRRCVHDAGHHR
jgi:hypothetical protein